jgi:uncharacterized protein YigE (DUF2233 family)
MPRYRQFRDARRALSVRWALTVACLLLGAQATAAHAAQCAPVTHAGNAYTVCRFDAGRDDLRLLHTDGGGRILGSFDAAEAFLAKSGQTLSFAMNAGMYHADRAPVGLLVIDGREVAPLNRSTSFGNFYLKPNGVFYADAGRAGVVETDAYRKSGVRARFATQSGPMLVIDGRLHPRFLVDASSKNIRNGVGVAADGVTVFFAISDVPVTFHAFGTLFLDELKTPNALYLDGSISRIYAPGLGRNDPGETMGPIVGAVATTDRKSEQGQRP